VKEKGPGRVVTSVLTRERVQEHPTGGGTEERCGGGAGGQMGA